MANKYERNDYENSRFVLDLRTDGYEKALEKAIQTGGNNEAYLNGVIDSLSISAETQKAARDIRTIIDSFSRVRVLLDKPDFREFIDSRADIALILRLGLYTNLIEATIRLRAESRKFLESRLNDPNFPEVSMPKIAKWVGHRPKGKMTPEISQKLKDYTHLYYRLASNVEGLNVWTKQFLGSWLNRKVSAAQLSDENPYQQVVGNGTPLGELLVGVQRAFREERRTVLTTAEYQDIMELLSAVVAQEALQTDAVLPPTAEASTETLAQTIFEQFLAAKTQVSDMDLPELRGHLQKIFRDGYPMYTLLYECIREIPSALANSDHDGQLVTIRICESLNKFRYSDYVPRSPVPGVLFNYVMCVGMIHREFLGQDSFQGFVYNLAAQADRGEENSAWFQRLAEYMMKGSTYFPHKVVSRGQDIEAHVFDLEKNDDADLDLASGIPALMAAGEYESMEVNVENSDLDISETALRGEWQQTTIHVHKMGGTEFIVNMTITLEVKKPEVDELGFAEETTRFNCQLKLDDGQVTVFLPVVDAAAADPRVMLAVEQHVRHLLGMIDVDALRARTEREKAEAQQKLAQPDQPRSKRKSREERKRDYQSRRPADQEEAQQVVVDHQNQLTSAYEQHEAELVSIYVPRQIVLTNEMRQALENPPKKGSKSTEYPQTLRFIEKYNAAPHGKPGLGMPFRDHFGPNGERIWRYHLPGGMRCLAVEVGEGSALFFMVDDHDHAYNDVSTKAGQTLQKYYAGV